MDREDPAVIERAFCTLKETVVREYTLNAEGCIMDSSKYGVAAKRKTMKGRIEAMKKSNRILMLILSLMLVMSVLAACGGGGGSNSEAEEAPAEPNSGIAEIVFAVPDGWETSETSENYLRYIVPDTEYALSVSTTSEDILKDLPEELKADTLEEFFNKNYKPDEERIKKYNLKQEEMKICDSDAYYITAHNKDDKYLEASAAWIYDNLIYDVRLFNTENFDDEGRVKEDATPMEDEMVKAFEGLVSSIKPGEGESLRPKSVTVKGIGDYTVDMPEGYVGNAASDMYIEMEKEGSPIKLSVFCTGEDTLSYHEIDGKKPESLDEYYNMLTERSEDADKTSIAGLEAVKLIYPNENDKYYDATAYFKDDNGVYEISMHSDAYDDEGKIKEDAVELTEDDRATFDAFLASFKKK